MLIESGKTDTSSVCRSKVNREPAASIRRNLTTQSKPVHGVTTSPGARKVDDRKCVSGDQTDAAVT